MLGHDGNSLQSPDPNQSRQRQQQDDERDHRVYAVAIVERKNRKDMNTLIMGVKSSR